MNLESSFLNAAKQQNFLINNNEWNKKKNVSHLTILDRIISNYRYYIRIIIYLLWRGEQQQNMCQEWLKDGFISIPLN